MDEVDSSQVCLLALSPLHAAVLVVLQCFTIDQAVPHTSTSIRAEAETAQQVSGRVYNRSMCLASLIGTRCATRLRCSARDSFFRFLKHVLCQSSAEDSRNPSSTPLISSYVGLKRQL
jgi:hypothetical protein